MGGQLNSRHIGALLRGLGWLVGGWVYAHACVHVCVRECVFMHQWGWGARPTQVCEWAGSAPARTLYVWVRV